MASSTTTEEAIPLTEEKVRENRLRRMAQRQGLALVKSRRRDPRAIDYGLWMIVDSSTNTVVAGAWPSGSNLDLDDVEAYLTGGPEAPGETKDRDES